jgi:hypothetical protein
MGFGKGLVSTMPTFVVAGYSATSSFKIPDGVFLLDKPYGPDVYGRWYIRWNELIYLDKDLNECKIQGSEPEVDTKVPEAVEFQEED